MLQDGCLAHFLLSSALDFKRFQKEARRVQGCDGAVLMVLPCEISAS